MRLKGDFYSELLSGSVFFQGVGWGKGTESRAFCILSNLECSLPGCPEVAGSFEMALAGQAVQGMTV